MRYDFHILLFLFIVAAMLSGQSRGMALQTKIIKLYLVTSGNFFPVSLDHLVGFKWGKTSADDELEISK